MIEVNLLPEEYRTRSKGLRRMGGEKGPPGSVGEGTDRWRNVLLVAAVIVPLAMVAGWLVQRSEAGGLEERLEAATADSARLADLRALSDSLSARQHAIRERVALIEQLDRDRFVWPHIMDEVSRAVPQLVWLTSLQQVDPQPNVSVQIQGLAATPLAITEFVRNLQASAYLARVEILGSQQQQVTDELAAQSFTLLARYRQPPGSVTTAPIVTPPGS
jgi:type IV pilus assembly protein PilN